MRAPSLSTARLRWPHLWSRPRKAEPLKTTVGWLRPRLESHLPLRLAGLEVATPCGRRSTATDGAALGVGGELLVQAATVACISHTKISAGSVAVTFCPPVAVKRTASPVTRGPALSSVTAPRGTNRCRNGAWGS